MADVIIKYNGSQIAELNGTGSKMMQTSGKYCEGDIAVEYAPRSKTYEITLAKVSGWVLLTTLDADVLAHINDPNLVVSLVCADGYEFVNYSMTGILITNTQLGMQGSYPVYGVSGRISGSTTIQTQQCYYPANKSDTSTSLGGGGMFRISSNSYYARPGDGYFRAGTYQLRFAW